MFVLRHVHHSAVKLSSWRKVIEHDGVDAIFSTRSRKVLHKWFLCGACNSMKQNTNPFFFLGLFAPSNVENDVAFMLVLESYSLERKVLTVSVAWRLNVTEYYANEWVEVIPGRVICFQQILKTTFNNMLIYWTWRNTNGAVKTAVQLHAGNFFIVWS